eukprot:8968311-Pyramimonas_sp.AAC.1
MPNAEKTCWEQLASRGRGGPLKGGAAGVGLYIYIEQGTSGSASTEEGRSRRHPSSQRKQANGE